MNGTRTRLFTSLAALIFELAVGSSSAFAEPPPLIPIQGILSDAQGAPIDDNVSIVFTVYAGNTPLFTEQSTIAVDKGSFNHYLGSVTPLQMSMFQNNTDLTLGIKVGSDSELSPRIKLGSVPYAAMTTNASNAMTLDGKSTDDFMAASPFLSSLSQTSIEGIARGVCYDTPDQLHAVLDPRYYSNVDQLRAQLNDVYVSRGESDSITSAMIGSALDDRFVNAGEANSITSTMVGTALDSRFVNAGAANSITSSMVGTALDARFVRLNQTNSISTSMIQASAVNRSKLHSTSAIYQVTVTNCEIPRYGVSMTPTCDTLQTNLGACPTCTDFFLKHKARTCSGTCTCVSETPSLSGQIIDYPKCNNNRLGYLVGD